MRQKETSNRYPTVRHRGEDLVLDKHTYTEGGGVVLQLYDADGFPYATATANVPGAELGEGEVLIKNYSENEGISKALQDAGVTRFTGRKVPCGFVELEVHELLV